MEQATTRKVSDLISFMLNIPTTRIHPFTSLKDDLLLDAIDVLLLIAALESKFDVYLSPEEAESVQTVEDIAFLLQKNMAVA
jgi:acyl carrier protein